MSNALRKFRVVGGMDTEQMPEQELISSTSDLGVLIHQTTRHGERLATVEAAVASLKDDSKVVRSALHEVNGKMQLFIIAEQACGSALKTIEETMRGHTNTIEKLMSARDQAYGIWWAIVRVCAVIVGVATLLSALVGFVGWMLEHHAVITFS